MEEKNKLDDDGAASWEVFEDHENDDDDLEGDAVPSDDYQYDYDDYAHTDEMWEDEDWTEESHDEEEDKVAVDSHILCTPVSLKTTLELHI